MIRKVTMTGGGVYLSADDLLDWLSRVEDSERANYLYQNNIERTVTEVRASAFRNLRDRIREWRAP